MLKIIVCEDITVIRNNLVDLLHRHYPEYDICGAYFDGQQVIDHLQKEPVDLIITDIRMKDISGIDVLKYVYENNFRTQVIIITAYADFDYALNAVNFHAAKFILKPISPTEFLQAVEEAAEKIAAAKEDREFSQRIADQTRLRSKTHRKLQEVYSGRLSYDQFKAYCEANNPALLTKRCLLLHISVKRSPSDSSTVFSWYDMTESLDSDLESCILTSTDNACVLLLFAPSAGPTLQQYEEYIRKIEQSSLLLYRTPLFLNATKFDSLEYLWGSKKEDFSAYIRYIEENNFAKKAAFEKDVLSSWSPDKIINLINSLCKHYDRPEFSVSVSSAYSRQDAQALFQDVMRKLSDVFDANYREIVIKKVDQYLQMNFANPDLSLTSVAIIFNFSPAYLSNLFSKYNNVTFSSRLMEIRLEHGKKLLKETRMPIKDIAASCGYTVKYFTRLFNKKMGVTPRAYRDRGIK